MWSSRGVRGSALESLLEYTHEYYHQLKLCRIDKVSTPIKVVEIDSYGTVTKGFFEKKSTVDFIGIIQGVFIAFDAKETALKSFPLKNLHEHQMAYMADVDHQGGLTFIIVHFKFNDSFYIVPFETLRHYYYKKELRSIPFSAMDERLRLSRAKGGSILNYLDGLNAYVSIKPSLKGD